VYWRGMAPVTLVSATLACSNSRGWRQRLDDVAQNVCHRVIADQVRIAVPAVVIHLVSVIIISIFREQGYRAIAALGGPQTCSNHDRRVLTPVYRYELHAGADTGCVRRRAGDGICDGAVF